MTRQPEKPHQALRAGLDQGLERTARAENVLQVAPGTEVMQLPEIEMGRPQARPRCLRTYVFSLQVRGPNTGAIREAEACQPPTCPWTTYQQPMKKEG